MPDTPQKNMPVDVSSMLKEANGHISSGDLASAAKAYKGLVALAPDDPNLHHTLGLVYFELNQNKKALFHIGRSLELNPSNTVAYRSMGDALAASGQFPLALRAYEKACTLDPNNIEALLNLGNLFHEQEMFDQARRTYDKILTRAPRHMQALNNLGKIHHDMGHTKTALTYYNQCIQIDPKYAQARFNRAALLLAVGDFKQGWREYEWRFKRSCAANVYPHQLSSTRWDGQNYRGRNLLVHCEQGMGDIFQFARFLPMVKARGGTLIVETHPPLVKLFSHLPYIDQVIAFDETLPPGIPHDLHVPLLSLPLIFNTRLETIPNRFPYIDLEFEKSGPEMMHIKPDKINIGLVWSSSDLNPKRNLPIHKCMEWFQNPGHHFIGLQKGAACGQLLNIKGNLSSITELGSQLGDFYDTGNILKNLNLLICVDTAAAHLAGAMGIPLWVLLPFSADWRWPLNVEHNPWYPAAKQFRQPSMGDWDTVINQVSWALQNLHR